ncbi:MAG: ATP-binding cassette domain-containing protein [Microcystis aeruginosa Ma_QC_Ch_20071001_S25]|jgi:ABC-2 type transport system ATP-binding protein|uniref:ATP-binding cassette domain-containing protein n=1 Tax=Microcystis aeruginosa Ma_QC_Ch_20071001_S25D TaxID=2486250 RepID=A0A552G5U0_MICAE|nr:MULTISPECIES: ATP-binding cassette domain-containing protein [unclassified Microcystis]MCA2761604.1 ATP-binding cassette domain-containing protein [Microcystis sp. M151S2]TRU50015.1 MAG: ATP-binding cassette domain-containing protein [Microcystis aeruginosa Ma_QC_Ch_20071001_S25]TRU54247.1 MAG: ATP-binding cassette domain-containing protein [Microcystis aeruginosa Ma_QC_Ch_20071001_S25D]TRU61869.1 MAG: ATP-binding cassette domain-containing protein [Microcystis aeruginosa Ma_QC_Ch_20071001_M
MIEVEHLSKIYGSTAAISDVDFTVKKGEILGFLGPNGAGKTTTMRILSGYIPATTGTARIAGYDVHQQSLEVRRRIGYLPENPPLYPEMTVESFLDFVARIKGISSGDRKARVDLVLSKCQLLEKRKVIIRKLSKGYKQRVGIAQAIIHDPPVIILDEPTVGLDPKQIIEVRNLIKSLAGEHTIILSTHILPEVSITCDRATIINRGRIVANNITTATPASSSYEIEIEGDRDYLLEILQQLPQVEQAAKVGDNLLKIVGQVGTNLGAELARIVVNNGYNLLEMRRTRKTLEDIFLEVIGSGENNHQEERHDQ